MAQQYAELFRTALDDAPLDRALLGAFAEMVRRTTPTRSRSRSAAGRASPRPTCTGSGCPSVGSTFRPPWSSSPVVNTRGIGFEVGEMGALDVADASLAGVVAWYSVIHVPASWRRDVIGEFHRVLRPGGYALLAFQVGDDTLRLEEAFGHDVSLDFHRLQPDAVVALLGDAGFEVTARLVRAPDPAGAAAQIPQGFLIAKKPC